jgi:glutathione S-transferase
MALVFYSASGSPYAWRVWLALEHKGAQYELKQLSFDAGELKSDAFTRLNPRRRVPVIDDNGFTLYESAAIVEYIEDKWPGEPRLFSADVAQRAIERRLIREADQYFAEPMERLVDAVLFTASEHRQPERIKAAYGGIARELQFWESRVTSNFLAGELSAADYTLFPLIALTQRIGMRNPGIEPAGLIGANVAAWMARMCELPVVQSTWPPHWRA